MKTKGNPQIVTVAVIKKNGSILIGKRKQGKHHVGNWEFPGGTVEEGETNEQCLKRELLEELGITTEVGPLICSSEHSYEPGWTIRLMAYRATIVSGDLYIHDYDDVRWIKPEHLPNYSFSAVAEIVAKKLSLEGGE